MVIEAIAAGAMAVLGPYLVEGGKSFAKKAGEALERKAETLYQSIKNKLAGDKDAEQTLAQVEAKPESKARQSSLEEVLIEKMQADSDFAMIIDRLVQEAHAADTRKIINITGDRNIAVGGNVNGSTFITGDNNRVDKP
jgi:hypothetical protein